MRRSLPAGVLWALVLAAAAASAASVEGGPATFTDALALAQQQNKVLVIDFYTDW